MRVRSPCPAAWAMSVQHVRLSTCCVHRVGHRGPSCLLTCTGPASCPVPIAGSQGLLRSLPQGQWCHVLAYSMAHSWPQPASFWRPSPALSHLADLSSVQPAAQRKTLPRSCRDLRCHVHLRGHRGQQHPQRGDVQVPGEAHRPAEQADTHELTLHRASQGEWALMVETETQWVVVALVQGHPELGLHQVGWQAF